MKIRMRHNSIRLRLDQKDVENLKINSIVTEQIEFGIESQILSYSLLLDDQVKEVHASFTREGLLVKLPIKTGKDWISSEELGISASQLIRENYFLDVLIEKDLKCLTEREGEDESNAFPNPMAEQGKNC